MLDTSPLRPQERVAFAGQHATDTEKLAKARRLFGESGPIARTPAAAYLMSRGIDAENLPADRVGWHARSGAIAFVAINADGIVQAIQRVMLNPDGSAKTEMGKKIKRSNGALKGAALSLPGHGDRVLICDGPEDALSIAEATGRPVRCAFGVAGMGDVPLPPGAVAVLVQDNDKDGAASYQATRNAAAKLGARGHLVLICRPPQGVKDPNDLLIAQGPAALVAMVESAEAFAAEAAFDCLEPDPRPVGCTDDALALAFTDRHGEQFRYIAAWGKWLKWSGAHWVEESTLEAFDLARDVCRAAAANAESAKIATIIAKASTVSAVERLARADRRHAATVDQWDRDPWLLNTPAGTIDLRRGRMVRHRPDQHITKITAVAPGGDCPNWLKFLNRAMNDDADMVGFLQRVAGYALTGSTRDHALFFVYGTGGNGKGVFINTAVGILGDYATVSPMETFTASTGDRHPTDLAMLRGSRLVTAQETEEGKQWAESKIKSLTGGDKISARFMRQDFFSFIPQFKLLIAGNHKPGLRHVDEAMRRRFHLIPFTVTIPADERDPELPDKLRAEWPGILKWMIQGCMEWQRIGLAPPGVVTDATTEYLTAEDSFATWMSECLTDASDWSFETSADLFASWKRWADSAGEMPGSQKRFAEQLQSRGFKTTRQHGGRRGFTGIALLRQSYPEDHYAR